MSKHFFLAATFVLLNSTSLFGQYFQNSGSFSSVYQRDFLFQPIAFQSQAIGDLKSFSGLFFDDFLNEVSQNPAVMSSLEENLFYIEYNQNTNYLYDYYYNYHNIIDIQPHSIYAPYSQNSYHEREPLIAAKLITNVFKNEKLKLGLSYQLLSFEEAFNANGLIFAFIGLPVQFALDNNSAGLSNLPQPLLSARNEQQHTGHFATINGSLAITESFTLGAKLGYKNYVVQGVLSDTPFSQQIDPTPGVEYFSNTDFNNNYDENYSDWDLTIGSFWKPNPQLNIGLSVGYLTGSNDQNTSRWFLNTYGSYYSNDYPTVFDLYNSSINGLSLTDGRTRYSNLLVNYKPNDLATIQFSYRWQQTDTEIGQDYRSSYSFRSSYEGSTTRTGEIDSRIAYSSNDESISLSSGNGSIINHQAVINIAGNLTERTQANLGVQVNFATDRIDPTNFFNQTVRNDQTFDFHDFNRPDSSFQTIYSNTSTNSGDDNFHRFMISAPLVIGFNPTRNLRIKPGIAASYIHDIYRNYSRSVSAFTRERIPGELTIDDTVYENQFRSSETNTFVHYFVGVSYLPTQNIMFRLTGASNQAIHQVRTTSDNTMEFRLSAEFRF